MQHTRRTTTSPKEANYVETGGAAKAAPFFLRSIESEARLARVQGQLAEKYRNQSAIAQRLAEVEERIARTSGMLHGASAAFRARTRAERAAAARRFEATGQALALKNRDVREIRAPTDGFVQGALALVNGNVVTGSSRF